MPSPPPSPPPPPHPLALLADDDLADVAQASRAVEDNLQSIAATLKERMAAGSRARASWSDVAASEAVAPASKMMTTPTMLDPSEPLALNSLPDTVLSQVLTFFSFRQVAEFRQINRRFNHLCGSRLNRGFRSAEIFLTRCMKDVKAKLPRRESERRNHPMARHCDILTAVETRISLLAMTFMKYVDAEMCCFIPGQVIDEIYKVVRLVKSEVNPPRAYEILQELRDISSMAMEYFDEKIVPGLRHPSASSSSPRSSSTAAAAASLLTTPSPAQYLRGLPSMLVTSTAATPTWATPTSHFRRTPGGGENLVTQLLRRKLDSTVRRSKKFRMSVRKLMSGQKQRLKEQQSKMTTLEELLYSQQALITSQAEKLKDQEAKLAELSRKVMDGGGKKVWPLRPEEANFSPSQEVTTEATWRRSAEKANFTPGQEVTTKVAWQQSAEEANFAEKALVTGKRARPEEEEEPGSSKKQKV